MDALLDGVLAHLRRDVYGAEFWPAELDAELRAAATAPATLRRTTLWLAVLAREPSVQALVEGTQQQRDGGVLFRRWLPLLQLETGRLHHASFHPETARDLCQAYVDRVRSAWLSRDTATMDAAVPDAQLLARMGFLEGLGRPLPPIGPPPPPPPPPEAEEGGDDDDDGDGETLLDEHAEWSGGAF